MTTILEHIADEVGKQIKAERQNQGTNLTTDINSILERLANGGPSTDIVCDNLNGQPYMVISTSPTTTLTDTPGAIICHSSFGNFQSARLLDFDTLPVWDRTITTNPSFLNYLSDSGKMLHKTYVKTHAVTIQNNGVDDVFYIDGVETPTLELAKGNQYIFDWSADLSNPFRLSETSDGTNSSGVEHTNGVVVDTINGTTTFTIVDDEVDQLFYYSDATSGIGGELTLKIPPYHTEQNNGHSHHPQNSSGLVVNMLKECTKRAVSPTGKVLFLCDTPPSDYQFYARGDMFQFLMEKACYWAGGLTLEVPSGNGVVTRQPSYFYNAGWNHEAYNHSWFLGDHYGYLETIDFFTNNSTISSVTDWKNYFSNYDCVIVMGVSKSVWFPMNATKGLAQARDQNGVGIMGLTDDSYYTRNINTMFAPYNISWQDRFSQLGTSTHYHVAQVKGQGYDHNYLFDGLHDDFHLAHSISDSYIAINSNNNSNVTIDLKIDLLRNELTSVDDYSPAVDREYRNLLGTLLGGNPIEVVEDEEITITNLGKGVFVFRNTNGIFRTMKYNDQVGEGGNDVYIRVDSNGNTISTPIADEYDATKSTIGTGSYAYDGDYPTIKIVKTGNYATGWTDVRAISQRIDNLHTIGKYAYEDLPASAENFSVVFDSTNNQRLYFNDIGWYRCSDDSISKYTQVDVFIMAGQSNTGGNGLITDLSGVDGFSGQSLDREQYNYMLLNYHDTASDETTTLNNLSLAKINPGLTTKTNTLHGAEISFADYYLQRTGRPVAIIKYYVDGSAISKWDKTNSFTETGTGNKNAWDGFIDSISFGLQELTDNNIGYTTKGLIWWQGESDANEPQASAYGTNLSTFLSDVRTHLDDPNLPATFIQVQNTSAGDINTIQDQQRDVANTDANSTLVTTNGIADLMNSGVHWSSAGHVEIGNRLAGSLYRLINGIADWSPTELTTSVTSWVDASESTDASKVTTSSGLITALTNQGSTGGDLVQGNTSKQPQVLVNGINGMDVANFARDADDLRSNFVSNAYEGFLDTAGNNLIDLTMFALVKYPNISAINTSGSGQLFRHLGGSANGIGSAFYAHAPLNNTTNITYFNLDAGTNVVWNTSLSLPDNQPLILEFTRSQTNKILNDSIREFRINGGSTIGTDFAQTNPSDGTTGVTAGALAWSYTCKHYLGEIIVYKGAITQEIRQKIEGYLAHKWQLANSLPSDHPYRIEHP